MKYIQNNLHIHTRWENKKKGTGRQIEREWMKDIKIIGKEEEEEDEGKQGRRGG